MEGVFPVMSPIQIGGVVLVVIGYFAFIGLKKKRR